MTRLNALRFSVFWIWVATLLITITVFLSYMISENMRFYEIEESISAVTSPMIPQIGVMIAFFFGSNKQRQLQLIDSRPGLAKLAIGLSLVYHITFWILLVVGIGFGFFREENIDESAAALIKISGFLAAFGLSPVAYFFASKGE